jgi:glutamyl-tRNA reductase
MPTVQCLGLNHRTAPVGMREQLGYTNDTVPVALNRAKNDPRIRHAVILSTCNRVEVYTSVPEDGSVPPQVLLTEFMAADHGLDPRAIEPSLYYLEGIDATRHLCRVASGLDSLVLGESQILTQVTSALRRAVSRRTVSQDLQGLFDTAIRAARRARSEAWGVIEPASISSVAVDQARADAGGDLSRANVVVVGAGDVSGLAVRALRLQAIGSLTIVNRTYDRAMDLAERNGAQVRELSSLPAALQDADVVLVTTASPHILMDRAMIAEAIATRPNRRMIIGDIAVPRNVDPEARHIPGVQLFDVDHVRPQLERSLLDLEASVPDVEAIIEAELETIGQVAGLAYLTQPSRQGVAEP